jgi:hypothetical protein
MAKKKSKKILTKQHYIILAVIIVAIISSVLIAVYKSNKEPLSKNSSAVTNQTSTSSEPPSKQTIEYTKYAFSNHYKNLPTVDGNDLIEIKDLRLSFPKSVDISMAYWISAKIDGNPVGASIADLATINRLLDQDNQDSLQKAKNCYEGLTIFASQQPTGYKSLFQKKLQDGRYYEIRQTKKECSVYIGDFTDYLSKAQSI